MNIEEKQMETILFGYQGNSLLAYQGVYTKSGMNMGRSKVTLTFHG